MTNAESKIFSKVLDTSMEVKDLMVAGKWDAARLKSNEHNRHVADLKELMGESEYDLFIEMGRRMFA